MEHNSLSTDEPRSAFSDDRGLAAIAQLEESGKADKALQQMIDAVVALPNLDHFIPAALRIVAGVFNAKDCAYYEHRRGDPIRLRYWLYNDQVLSPDAISALTEAEFAFMRHLAMEGFTVPDSYLGLPFRLRTKASIVDHERGDPPSVFDDYCNSRGWHMELNVPLVVAGEADGALLTYRKSGCSFSPGEIALAERLGQQFALAIEASRLANAANQAAVAQERERAAQQRADEIARYSNMLKQTVDSLVAEEDFRGFVGRVLGIVATQLESPVAEYWMEDGQSRANLVLTYRDGIIYAGSDRDNDIRVHGIDIVENWSGNGQYPPPNEYLIIDMLNQTKFRQHAEAFGMPIEEWCKQRNVQRFMFIPLLRSGVIFGRLCIFFPAARIFEPPFIEFALGLAQQFSLAVRMTELAEDARQTARVQEREAAALHRAAELSRYSGALEQTVDSLVAEEDFRGLVERMLIIAGQQLCAPVAEYWTLDGQTCARLVLTCRQGIVYAGSDDEDDVRVRGIDVSFNWSGNEKFPATTQHLLIDMVNHTGFREMMEGMGMPVREWCKHRGVQQCMLMPLQRVGQTFGTWCVYFPAERTFEPSFVDFARSFGQQIALAVRMTELAEESKRHAISQEREAAAASRSAELSRANAVLQATLERLSQQQDLRHFPTSILRTAMEQTGARDGVLLVLDPISQTLHPADYLTTSQSSPLATDGFNGPFGMDSAPIWDAAFAQRAPIVIDVERDGHLLLPGGADWNRQRGNQSVVIAPLFINKELYGYFGISMKTRSEGVSSVDLGLIQALAQQATLAIQLTRLADETQQKALAEERERDAQLRATELGQANEVLRSTLDQLSEETDLHTFSRTILKEAMNQMDGRHGLILVHDSHADTLTRAEYIAREELPGDSLDTFPRSFPASTTPAWTALVDCRAPIVFDVESDGPRLLPGLSHWHRQRGNKSIVAVAMFIGSTPYGYFGITLAERAADVSQVKVELIHALTQQATLSVQLTRLAEASQQAAIVVERQQVVVQERANMAREIHDRLAQGYAAILIQQHAMRRSLLLTSTGEDAAVSLYDHLDIIERLSRSNLAEARKTMDDLKIDPFGPGDLGHSLRHCIGNLARERDFEVLLTIDDELPPVRRYVEGDLCRIVLEAVSNARKHARTASVRVRVSRDGNGVSLVIEDDGVGFDADRTGGSFGISSMQERAARAGAELRIVSAPGRGTRVHVRLM